MDPVRAARLNWTIDSGSLWDLECDSKLSSSFVFLPGVSKDPLRVDCLQLSSYKLTFPESSIPGRVT